MKTICLMALVLLVGMSAAALASPPTSDPDAWFGDAAGDGGLWTTPSNWWRGTVPSTSDPNGAGHDTAGATLTVNSTTGNVSASALYIGVWGPGEDGKAYLNVSTGVCSLTGEVMIGYRAWDGGSWWDNTDPCNPVEMFWSNYGNGSVTIDSGFLLVGSTLGLGSTDFKDGVGGIGELHIDGGILRAVDLAFGVVDPCIPGDLDHSVDITDGKLLLEGNISSLDARVTAFGGVGYLEFNYEADQAGYTTITAVPEPTTLLLLGLGGLAFRRKKA